MFPAVLLLFSGQVVSDSFATPWSVAHQVPLSMGFPRQEYWSGLPFPFPGDLPDPGTEPASLALRVDLLLLSHQGSPFSAIQLRKSRLREGQPFNQGYIVSKDQSWD